MPAPPPQSRSTSERSGDLLARPGLRIAAGAHRQASSGAPGMARERQRGRLPLPGLVAQLRLGGAGWPRHGQRRISPPEARVREADAQAAGAALLPEGGVAGPEVLYNLALGAMAPIFEGGRLKGQLEFSLAQKEDALASVRAAHKQQQTDQQEAATFPGRLAVLRAHAARLQSMVTLYRALGGGWEAAA